MTSRDPEKLLDDVIAYLKQQRKMFGDFDGRATPAAAENAGSSHEPNYDEVTADSSVESSSQQSTRKTSGASESAGPVEQKQESDASTEANGAEQDSKPDEYESDAEAPSLTDEDRQQATESVQSSGKKESSLFASNPDASDNIYDQVEACESLKELFELCKQTDLLRTDLEDTNLVFGVGNTEADLVLIGEAPGSKEDKQGEPFVGRAGQLLNKILDAIDLDRGDVYIANILKHRPPGNRNPLPEEVKRSLPFLLKQLDLIQPKLILCLGKVAANTLLEKNTSLKSMRGTFYSYMDRYELMVTYHPAALLRNERFKRPTWEDMKKLRNRYEELGCQPQLSDA
jgi:DNA polymerase